MRLAEHLLPVDVIRHATIKGTEYAWPVHYIPTLIDAAKSANLVNIGGQLQFRLSPNTCELYWIEVDTYRSISEELTWTERVSKSAEIAFLQFQKLCNDFDFAAEGLKAFGAHLEDFQAQGGDLDKAMCFVWYVEAEPVAP